MQRQVAAGLLDQLAEAQAAIAQAPLQAGGGQFEPFGHQFQRRFALGQGQADLCPGIFDQARPVFLLTQSANHVLDQEQQVGVALGHHPPLQVGLGYQQRIARALEQHRRVEHPGMLLPALRPGMLEGDRARCPLIAERMAQQVERHAHGQLGVLAAIEDRIVANLVVEAVALAAVHQADQRAVLMVGKGGGEVPQRVFEGLRTQADIAEQPQGARMELLAVAQAEIVAARLPRGFFEHFAVVGQGQAEGRVAQLFGVDAGTAEDAVEIAALAGNEAVQPTGGRRQHADIAGRRDVETGGLEQGLAHHGVPALRIGWCRKANPMPHDRQCPRPASGPSAMGGGPRLCTTANDAPETNSARAGAMGNSSIQLDRRRRNAASRVKSCGAGAHNIGSR
ncbi:hypothetical protein D3C80_887090 [compost metagenome]